MSDEHLAKGVGKPGRLSRRDLYRQLDAGVNELWERLGGLPTPQRASQIWEGIWYEEAHHSTAIEGNTLVLKQVRLLLAEGRAVGNKELAEYNEVKGYATAADWVYSQAASPAEAIGHSDLITVTEVRQVHQKALSPVWDVAPHPEATEREAPGSFREHEIREFPGGMQPTSWPLIPAAVSDWVDQVNQLEPRTDDFPERLAALHARFEQIHPFLDGNGRCGRLLLNLILVRCGYPPAVIYKKDRPRYLRALERADQGNPGLLGEMIARAVIDNLYRFVIPNTATGDELVPLASLATKHINTAALRAAARRGRLQATRNGDGRWRSTRTWVDQYLTSRHERD